MKGIDYSLQIQVNEPRDVQRSSNHNAVPCVRYMHRDTNYSDDVGDTSTTMLELV